jgi:hypothetical protein
MPRPRGRSSAGKSRCQCGCPWQVHQTHHRGKPCMRCACVHYVPRPRPPTAPRVPTPPPGPAPLLREATRLACVPEAHTGREACPACTAWERGRVLLTDGRDVAKMLWIHAHEAAVAPADTSR